MPTKRCRPLQSPNPTADIHSDDVPDTSSNVDVLNQPSDGHSCDDEIANVDVKMPVEVGGAVAPNSKPSDHVVDDTAVQSNTPANLSSPGRNRAAFLLKHSPSRLSCNLDLARCPVGTKVNLVAVVIAAFPAHTNPDRRYIQLADATGSVGVTVWNSNVAKFNRESIGKVVVCGKVVLGHHQGKKVLTMSRDSTLDFAPGHAVNDWWNDALTAAPLKKLSSVADIEDNSIINVAGILGLVHSEQKIVGTVQRTLTTLHLCDPSGEFDIRSWNHSADEFLSFVEKPVLIQRIRMASFAGVKIGELLDNSASKIVTDFPGKQFLENYWCD
jgi:hypothetical protein